MEQADDVYGYASAAYDAAAKRLLSKRKILAFILKHTVPEFRDVSLADIENVCIEGEPEVAATLVDPDYTNTRPDSIRGDREEDSSPTEGRITFDVLFRAVVPGTGEPIELIINLEAQKSHAAPYSLLKRAEYYGARLVSAQKNVEFAHSDYDGIKKVYSIWIGMTAPGRRSSINSYTTIERCHLGNHHADPREYQLINVLMVYLGDYRTGNKLIEMLRVLFRAEIAAADKRARLQNEFNLQIDAGLEEGLSEMCNLSEGVAERAMKKGREQGKKQGRKQGVLSEKVAAALRMLQANMTLDVIAIATALSIPKIRAIAAENGIVLAN